MDWFIYDDLLVNFGLWESMAAVFKEDRLKGGPELEAKPIEASLPQDF